MNPPAPATHGLEARGASYHVQRKALLDGADLAFPRGSYTAVVGPNGSGKTTLLRLLAGVRAPTRGEVRLDGEPIGAYERSEIAARLSYVPQNTWTDFDISVVDAVAMGRLPHRGSWRALTREDYEAVHGAIERVDLAGFAERTLPTLSGGERQRVFVARALAQGSPIVVLDEPTSALDVGHQLALMDVLARLHADGRTLVVAMHDLELAWDHVPRAVLLAGGRVAAEGATRDVLVSRQACDAFGVRLAADRDGHLHAHRRQARAPEPERS